MANKRQGRKTPTQSPIANEASASEGKPARSAKKAAKAAKTMDGTCFVLMPFKEPFDTYYGSILQPAVEAAGLEPLRGDSLFRPSPIMADIWRMIQDAKVVVAELTEKNANVFYELGLAHAVGKPVVMIAESIADVPFDLQSLRVILYDKNDPAWGKKLKTSITASVKETLTDTATAIPSMFRKVVKSQAPAERDSASRLDAIERQLASMEQGGRFHGGLARPIRDPSDLRAKLSVAGSQAEAVATVRAAIDGGLSSGLIEKVVSTVLPPTIAKDIIADAVRSKRRPANRAGRVPRR